MQVSSPHPITYYRTATRIRAIILVATQSSFQADVPFGSQTKDCTNIPGLGRDKSIVEKV